MAIGSIMSYSSARAHVWGSGIISRKDRVQGGKFYAVRGPLTRKRLSEQGHSCPEIYGDPALLLPRYYWPEVPKKYEYGIIPHYVDYERVSKTRDTTPDMCVIDLMTDNLQATTDKILQCKRVISSSLHGVIIAHAYGIPAIWVRFSEGLSGDNVKFEDYFLSVHIRPYIGDDLDYVVSRQKADALLKKYPSLPKKDRITILQDGLINAFPRL